MPKLLIGSISPKGEKMLGCEQKKREIKKRERKKSKKKIKNKTINQSIKGSNKKRKKKKRGRQKLKIEVSPRDRGEQNSPIFYAYLGEESESIHLESHRSPRD